MEVSKKILIFAAYLLRKGYNYDVNDINTNTRDEHSRCTMDTHPRSVEEWVKAYEGGGEGEGEDENVNEIEKAIITEHITLIKNER